MSIPEIVTDRMTIHQALATVLPMFSEQEAFVAGERRITYKEFGERVNALAGSLYALGLAPGDRVAVILPNSPEFVYAFFAISQAGGVMVPLNPLYKQRELRHMLGESEAVAAILVPKIWGNDLLGTIQGLRAELPALRHLIVAVDDVPEGALSLASLLAGGNPSPPADLRTADDLFALLYTSGTTGIPKAVMHTHHSLLAPCLTTDRGANQMPVGPALQQWLARYGPRYAQWRGKPETGLAPLPYHGIAGPGILLGGTLKGSRLIIMERFNPVQCLELIERERVNNLTGTPDMFRVMLEVKDFERYDKSSLLTVNLATTSVPPELARRVRDAFGGSVMIPFGATETGGAALITRIGDPDEQVFNTVGTALPGVKIKIVDEHGQPVQAGEVGELVCLREGIMPGYYKAPEATAAVVDSEGWYYTGDLAMMDELGAVRIVGRKKDVIIRGGVNIYPQEIENLLLAKPEVQMASVVGVSSRVGGEKVWAFVTLEPGAELSLKELLAYCRSSVAPHKVPDEVRILESLPLTPTGKVQKFMLRDMVLNNQV